MIKIPEYNQVPYTAFQKALHRAFIDSEKLDIQVAVDIKVKTPNTIQNTFNPKKQIVSDKVLTGVIKSIGMDGFVLWENGVRQYFIATKRA